MKTPLENSKGVKFTRYHLDSRQRTSHTAPFPAGRKFRQWLGISSSPQRPSTFAGAQFGVEDLTTLNAVTGVSRDRLIIHRSGSKAMFRRFHPAHSHQTGLSEGFRGVLSSSQLFSRLYGGIIPRKDMFCQHEFLWRTFRKNPISSCNFWESVID